MRLQAHKNYRKMKKFILLMTLAGAAVAVSCQKLPSVVDADGEFLVSTSHDTGTDFGTFSTFTVVDSIMVLDSRFFCDTVKNTFTDRLVEEFRTQMESRGYTYVAIEDVRDEDDPAHADLGIQLTYIAETDYYTDYVDPYWWLDYPGYWSPSYWGGWGGWYYPYPVTYQFTTHSLMAEMADLGAAAGEDQKLPVVWNCVINGESGSARSDFARFLTAIGQAFSQSAYLDVASE